MICESRNPDELIELIEEQLKFIANSAMSFDCGFEGESKRIALSVRVLAHNTDRSASLLNQAGRVEAVGFVDSCIPFDPQNQFSHCGLVKYLHIGGSVRPVPLFEDSPAKPRIIPLSDWWNGIVFVGNDGAVFSRRDIVLTMANKEGGGHVDPRLDPEYAALTRSNPPGWTTHSSDIVMPAANPVPAALRQIAHEVLATLMKGYVAPRPELPEGAFISTSPIVHFASQPPQMPAGNTVKKKVPRVGRNDPCRCGSGEKHKKCCGR